MHDFSSVKADFDIMFRDIPYFKVRSEIAVLLQIHHLGKSEKMPEEYRNVSGVLFGEGLRAFVPLVLDNGKKKIDVVFLVDTGSPTTFISDLTLKSLGMEFQGVPVKLNINGYNFSVEQSRDHFMDINVLGSDFMWFTNATLTVKYSQESKIVNLKLEDK